MVVVLINNYELDQIEASIEHVTDSLLQARLTKTAILEHRWSLGLVKPWQRDRCTIRSVEIKILTNPLMRGRM